MSNYENEDLSVPEVATKYTTCAELLNAVLKDVIAKCVDGAKVIDICAFGDNEIATRFGKVYNKKVEGEEVMKGIAYPTCIAVNELFGGVSPVSWETADAAQTLKTGDLVKIDLAAHIDGFPVITGHSVVVGAAEVTGRQADLLKALELIGKAVNRLVKPGNTNVMVTKAIKAIAAEFDLGIVGSVASHEMSRFILDGHRAIFARDPQGEERLEEFEFGLNEVYGIDIALSTGTGKLRETDIRPSVFKRDLSSNAELKTTAGRTLVSVLNKKYPLAFATRDLDEKVARLGTAEGVRARVLDTYSIFTERAGEVVGSFKGTLLVLPSQTKYISGALPFQPLVPTREIQSEEIQNILKLSTKNKKAKKE